MKYPFIAILAAACIIMTGCVEWTSSHYIPAENLPPASLETPRIAVLYPLKMVPASPYEPKSFKNKDEAARELRWRIGGVKKVKDIWGGISNMKGIAQELTMMDIPAAAVIMVDNISDFDQEIIELIIDTPESEFKPRFLSAMVKGGMETINSGEIINTADLKLIAESKLSDSEKRQILSRRAGAIYQSLKHIAEIDLTTSAYTDMVLGKDRNDCMIQLSKLYDYAIYCHNVQKDFGGKWTHGLPYYSFFIIPSIETWDYIFPITIVDLKAMRNMPFTLQYSRVRICELLMAPVMLYMDENCYEQHYNRARYDYPEDVATMVKEYLSTAED